MARPVFSDQQVEETRQRLCRIALGLYRAEGYDAVTLRELGTVAGVSHSTLYRYFHSKEDLFVHVRAEVFRQLGEYLIARDPPEAHSLTRLRSIAMSLAKFGREAPEDYRLIFSMRQAATDPDSPLAKARTQVLGFAVSICQQAIDDGLIGGDAITQAHLAWASVHGVLSLHVSNLLQQGCTIDDLLTTIVDRLFTEAMLPNPKQQRASHTTQPSQPRKARHN